MDLQEVVRIRSVNWDQLESLCGEIESKGRRLPAEDVYQFSSLYRSACADLALAESYHFPTGVVDRLKALVVRSHSLLYSKKESRFKQLFSEMPRAIVTDPYVHFCFLVFWIIFTSVCLLVQNDVVPGLAQQIVGEQQLEQFDSMHGSETQANAGGLVSAAGFYIFNNAGIGLMCFALSVVVIPGIAVLVSNAAILGATFGYLLHPSRGPASENFQTFVLAHGPFELTAIVLSAGAGLRIGMSLVDTKGLDRKSSFLFGAQKALPVIIAAVIFFCIAAAQEGLISNYRWNKDLAVAERVFKGSIGMISSWALILYFVGLGIIKPLLDGTHSIDDIDKRAKGDESWI